MPYGKPADEIIAAAPENRSATHGPMWFNKRTSFFGRTLRWPSLLSPLLSLVRISLAAVVTLLEALVSRRGIAILFFSLAGLLTVCGWLRPPLSPDTSSLYISLGLLPSQGASPETMLHGAAKLPWDSAGIVLLVVIVLGAAAALVRPKRLAVVAGVMLVAGMVANAAAAFQHPALIEALVDESFQHHNVVGALEEYYEHALSQSDNGRVHVNHPYEPAITFLASWPYLQYGLWFVVLSVFGVLFGARGPLLNRFMFLGGWIGLGSLCAALLCLPQLLGEYNMYRSTRLLLDGNYAESRRSLENAVRVFPELAQLQRTWLLRGELDYRESSPTVASQVWQAWQYVSLSRFEMARGLMAGLSDEAIESPAVRARVARMWVTLGIEYLKIDDFGAAEGAFRNAAFTQPGRFDCPFCLAIARAKMDCRHPQQAEAEMTSFLEHIADPQLQADALNIVGDAYFDADIMREARLRYMKSWSTFNLLEDINFRAQKGLGGL
jgi:hypothetical protein